MKALIVYYSRGGNNETLAKELQRLLDCDILKIDELKRRTWVSIFIDLIFNRMPPIKYNPCSLAEYDHVICIAPIWASTIAPPLKTFLNTGKDSIKQYSFISVCGGSPGQKGKIEKQLTNMLGKHPHAVAELWITNLPGGKKDTSKYKINRDDIMSFEKTIRDFLSADEMPFATPVIGT